MTDDIRRAFVIYLASSPRPINELLDPNQHLDFKSFEKIFTKEFIGMTDVIVSQEELINIRFRLVQKILNDLTLAERKFLLSLKSVEPDWNLMPIQGIEKLPSLQWKILNIKKIEKSKRTIMYEKLKTVLEL